MLGRVLTVALVLFALTPVLAQGAAAISNANTEIRKYWDPIKLLIQGIGGVVGLIGGLRIYNKWTNGDQDINKEVVGQTAAYIRSLRAPEPYKGKGIRYVGEFVRRKEGKTGK